MALVSWHFITSAQYKAATDAEKSTDKLFFLSDTKEIYRGTVPFTESTILYETLPESGAVGKLYINKATLEGRVWNGTAWDVVIKPVAGTVEASNTDAAVSGKAVVDYVTKAVADATGAGNLIADVSYNAEGNKLVLSMTDETTKNVPMTGVAVDLVYDKATGKLQVKNASGDALGTGINLDLERFVTEAGYDAATHKITLRFNDESDVLEIDVADLVDTYTAKNSGTIKLTVTGNEFVAEAILAADEAHADNRLVKTDNGLYVAPTDISGKIDKVEDATAGNVAVMTADGSVADGSVAVGGATLGNTPSAAVLATEAAVAVIRTTLNTSIAEKMAKVGIGHTGEVIVAAADGDASASGYKVGGAAFATEGGEDLLATEAGVAAYVNSNTVAKTSIVKDGSVAATVATASDDKVVSEKAFVNAMTWKTTV